MESTPPSATASIKQQQHAETKGQDMAESPAQSPTVAREGDKLHTSFNAPNWQATGVINNLPPRAQLKNTDHGHSYAGQSQRIQEMRHDTATGSKVVRPEYEGEGTARLQEDAEVGRAAELALREVLSSLEAAKRRVEPEPLFDNVDFFSLSFPGLCLAILPAPTTLYNPIPFAGADTWSLGPPGQRQMEALNIVLSRRFREKQQRSIEDFPDPVCFKYAAHASAAWEHWQNLRDHEQANAWNLEILRACSKAQEQQKHCRQELETAKYRIRHLEAEYDRLSRCQLPREYLLHPPTTLPLSEPAINEFMHRGSGTIAASADFDADALIKKWRDNVRSTIRRNTSTTSAVAAQQGSSAPAGYQDTHGSAAADQLRGDMVLNGAVFGVNGPMRRGETAKPGEPVAVDYETPPNPGAVVGDDEDVASTADAPGETDGGDSSEINALVQRRDAQSLVDTLNANGKRPYAIVPPVSSRTRKPKLLKECVNSPEHYSREYNAG